MKDTENIDLNYEVLLLNHLNRISELSTRIMGFVQYNIGMGQPTETHFKESDKIEAFHWGVRVFASIIPDELKDETYNKDLSELKQEMKDWREKKQNYETSRANYDVRWLGFLVNLLNRKGYLTESKSIGSVIKKKCEIKK